MKIYRFEKNTATRLNTIKEGNLYISPPKQFNDLNDCKIQAIFTPYYSKKYYSKLQECLDIIYRDNNHDFPLPDVVLEKLRVFFEKSEVSDKDQMQKIKDTVFSAGVVFSLRTYLRERTGLCCFFRGALTESLMWAHYGDNHKGFCIEYEVLNLEDLNIPLYPVIYTNNQSIPSINELLFCPNETFTRILTSKSPQWSYEKEYRLVYLNEIEDNKLGKNIPLPQGIKPVRIITGVKFNQNMDSETKKLFDGIDIEKVNYKKFLTNLCA